ncbi:MAG: cytochrome P450 [Bacteroidota bacterium]
MKATTPPFVSGAKPLLGHAIEFSKNKHTLFTRGYKEHGAIYSLKMPGGKRIVMLNSPDYAQTYFELTDKSLNLGEGLSVLKPFLGDLLALGGVEQYYLQRPLVYENFKNKRMGTSVEAMNIEVMRWLKSLQTEGELSVQDQMVHLTQEVASMAFFGPAFKERVSEEYWKQFGIIGDALDFVLPPWLPIPKFIRRERAKKVLLEMVKGILEERRSNPNQYDDFLQTLIDTPQSDGSHIDDGVAAQMIMFLSFAGHETTAIQASWTILFLLQNPMYLRLVQEEIDTHVPPGTVITPEVLMKLQHVFWAVDETTRLRPSAEMLTRVVDEDLELAGYDIPKGTILMLSTYFIQRMPELFSNPEVYDPLRFAPGREEHKLHPHSLLGFGGMQHKCAGMNFARNEMAIIVALMFQQFDWELISNPQLLIRAAGSRITESTVRYRKRTGADRTPTQQSDVTYSPEIIAACPHLSETVEAKA